MKNKLKIHFIGSRGLISWIIAKKTNTCDYAIDDNTPAVKVCFRAIHPNWNFCIYRTPNTQGIAKYYSKKESATLRASSLINNYRVSFSNLKTLPLTSTYTITIIQQQLLIYPVCRHHKTDQLLKFVTICAQACIAFLTRKPYIREVAKHTEQQG